MTTVETGVAGGISFALSDEQKGLRALAHEFAEKEIRPARPSTTSTDSSRRRDREGARGRPDERPPAGGARRPRPGRPSTACSSARSSAGAAPGSAPRSLRTGSARGPMLIAGTDEQKRAVAAAARSRSRPLLVRPHGAGRGLRRVRHPDHRRAPRRRVRHQRLEDVHHERRPRAWIVVFATTDRRRGTRPVGVRRPDGAPASRSRSTWTRWASARPTRRRSRFQDVVVPAANRLGDEGEGFKIAMQTLDYTRPGTAAARSGWRGPRTSSPSSTRRSASSSACRSR